MTSCHGGEAITSSSSSVDCWRKYSNLCEAFLYFSFLETGLGNTVLCLSKKEVLSVAC